MSRRPESCTSKLTPRESAGSALLALVIAIVGAIVGAIVLGNFAACEQYDAFCAFTGEDSK